MNRKQFLSKALALALSAITLGAIAASCASLPALAAQAAPDAQGRIDCGSIASKILKTRVAYCAYLPPGVDATAKAASANTAEQRYPVLYYLHGLGDNERSLVNTGAWNIVEDLRTEHKLGDFIIVTPDAGQSFYVNAPGGRHPYHDFFIREFMPFIEHTYPVRTGRAGRAIGGFSMGGFGALHFAFTYPQMFTSVAAESPALIRAAPRLAGPGAESGLAQARVLTQAFGNPIDPAAWNASSPFELAKRNATELARLKIYVDCGQDDDYGFNRGVDELAAEFKSLKVAADVHIYPGRHDVPYLLEHFGEALQFQWKAFQAAGK